MSKILIIGVGGAGANTVKRMKEVGIPNANFITFGGYSVQQPGITHYDLIEMNSYAPFINSLTAKVSERLAENVKDKIGEIIEEHLKQE
ncbi:MAG: hypothetical protein BHV69_03940 [Bacteroidales bacterium 52_46]|nr:MAG: hypothetical protein BHV69_03940 [Bacteroidales bacterium 52_46]